MQLIIQLAKHFLCRKNSHRLSYSSIISLSGIALGICAFLVVMTVLNSFQKEMKNLIADINPHVVIYSENGIAQVKNFQKKWEPIWKNDIIMESPFIFKESIASHEGHTSSLYLRAIPGSQSASASRIQNFLNPTNALGLLKTDEKKIPKIILGYELLTKLQAHINDSVDIMSFDSNSKKMNYIKYQVVGIFHAGISQYDKQLAFIDFKAMQNQLKKDDWATGIEFSLKDREQAINLAQKWSPLIPFSVLPWQEIDKSLFLQIERDSRSLKLIVFVISFVACFNVIITLVFTVLDRTSDISILRSLGATKKLILTVFIFCGVFLGVLGAILGICIAYILTSILSSLSIGSFQEFYYLEKVPAHMEISQIIISFSLCLMLSFLGSLYPAWRATRISPLSGL